MLTLTSTERRALRAQAHALDPVVMIGQHGLTPSVLREIDRALSAHELIKVRIFNDDRAEREALQLAICQQLVCAPVQHLGKLIVLWRPAPPKEATPKPAKRPAKKAVKKVAAGAINRQGQAIKPLSARQARQLRESGEPPTGKMPFADDRRPPRSASAGRGSRVQTSRPPATDAPPPRSRRGAGRFATGTTASKTASKAPPKSWSATPSSPPRTSSAPRPANRRRLGGRGKA